MRTVHVRVLTACLMWVQQMCMRLDLKYATLRPAYHRFSSHNEKKRKAMAEAGIPEDKMYMVEGGVCVCAKSPLVSGGAVLIMCLVESSLPDAAVLPAEVTKRRVCTPVGTSLMAAREDGSICFISLFVRVCMCP